MTNLIVFVKSLFSKDSGLFQKVRCSFFGKEQDIKVLNTYGISFGPPGHLDDEGKAVDPSFGVALRINGYGDEIFVLLDRPDLRFTGLEEGELKIGNTLLGKTIPANKTFIHFKADGSIVIKANTTVDVIAPLVNVSGDVVVVGNITANNFISSGLPGVDFNTHVHSDPQGGDTGVPK